jgi:hypothetical protein
MEDEVVVATMATAAPVAVAAALEVKATQQ